MLSYRHYFHAGNFADVFKHAVLVGLLLRLCRKQRPYCYLDTHAGLGLYDLNHPWARKNAEWRDGIGRIWDRDDAPKALQPYVDAVRAENPDGNLRFYPGSPRIARGLLRAGDRMVLCELNRADYLELRRRFRGDPRVGVHHMDGYQGLAAFLPPTERRGLVLVDSGFDRAGEYARVTDGLERAHARWPTGILACWYPLMAPEAVTTLTAGIAGTGMRRVLRLELSIYPERWTDSLRGCGMLLVNPPFRFDDEAAGLLRWLAGALRGGSPGGWRVDWLVPE